MQNKIASDEFLKTAFKKIRIVYCYVNQTGLEHKDPKAEGVNFCVDYKELCCPFK